jgi:hypothetical protein
LSEDSIARCQDGKWAGKGEEDCFVIHGALQGMILILVLRAPNKTPRFRDPYKERGETGLDAR